MKLNLKIPTIHLEFVRINTKLFIGNDNEDKDYLWLKDLIGTNIF